MRIFKSNAFEKFARKHKISDSLLINAINEIENGLIDADLGSGVIKQRLAKAHRGKSKGYRTIILYKTSSFSLFVFGYDKKDQTNLSTKDLNNFKDSARTILAMSDDEIAELVDKKIFIEVQNE